MAHSQESANGVGGLRFWLLVRKYPYLEYDGKDMQAPQGTKETNCGERKSSSITTRTL